MEEGDGLSTEEKRGRIVEEIISAPAEAVEEIYDEIGSSLVSSAGSAIGAAAGTAVGGPVGGILGAVVGKKAAGKISSQDGPFVAEGAPPQWVLTPTFTEPVDSYSSVEWGPDAQLRMKFRVARYAMKMETVWNTISKRKLTPL